MIEFADLSWNVESSATLALPCAAVQTDFGSLSASLLLIAVFAVCPCFAQSPGGKPPVTGPRAFITHHQAQVNATAIDYSATVGETILRDEKGEAAASLFSITYTKDGVRDLDLRPVAFIFNGGPGSDSALLHMAAFGPRRAAVPEDGKLPGAPPYFIVNNDYSLLDVTDMVFIDPIGTGFSRLLPAGRPEDFFGTIEDGRSITQFIQLWVNANKRWNSPKLILGESYGTVRAAELVRQLPSVGILINGVILLGQAMDFTQTTPIAGLDTAYPLILPTMAATAWYYGKVNKKGRTLEEFVEEARQFAQTEYASALFAGNRLTAEKRAQIAGQLSGLTGLPVALILAEDLRVTAKFFCSELLKGDGKSLSRYDGRYSTPGAHGPNEGPVADPIFNVTAEVDTLANQYLRSELAVTLDETYEGRSAVAAKWRYDEPPIGSRLGVYENAAPFIGDGMRQDPDLRVFVACGYYDLLTPLFSAEHTVAHAGMPLDRVQFGYYHAGHMPYLGESNLKKLSADLRAFIGAGRTSGKPKTASAKQ